MKPVKQSIIHDPDNGKYGDCFRACIASLLELPIDKVPHFVDGAQPVNWYKDLIHWLAPRGLAYYEWIITEQNRQAWKGIFTFQDVNDIYHTIIGVSPRHKGSSHCVIGLNGEVHFDPHPSNVGLGNNPITGVGLIIKTCKGSSL